MRRETAYDCDVLVVGGGIVGLSTAFALTRAAPGTRVTVLDPEPGPDRRTGHESGVVHSGIHYRPGSLRARYAVRGAAELVRFCAEQGIAHAVTGQLVVATRREELPRLHALAQRGRRNGVAVRELGPAQITEYEPQVRGLAAIHVAGTGVCDLAGVARRLTRISGAAVRHGAQVAHVDRSPEHGVAVRLRDGAVLRARVLVNCAGPHGGTVARLAGDDPGLRIESFRGVSYSLARPLVGGVVHPVPDPALPFPGVRLARDIDGGVSVGAHVAAAPAPAPAVREGRAVPRTAARGRAQGAAADAGRDVRTAVAPDRPGGRAAERRTDRPAPRRPGRYDAGDTRRPLPEEAFAEAVRRLLPSVTRDELVPGPARLRTRAVLRDGTPFDDFLIKEGPRTVHVLNASSPAVTASLPLGREVGRRVLTALNRV